MGRSWLENTPADGHARAAANDYLDAAFAELTRAVQLDAGLWRAHYLLGCIYRDRGFAQRAAEYFREALRSGPTEAEPWIAQLALYRVAHHDAPALALAKLAIARVQGLDLARIWHEVGLLHLAQHRLPHALESFAKALDIAPARSETLLERAQTYVQLGDLTRARRDLRAVLDASTTNAADRTTARYRLDSLDSQASTPPAPAR